MRLILFVILISLSFCSFGQKGKAILQSIDTVKGAQTKTISAQNLSGNYNSYTSTFYFDEVGGTSDGTMIMQGANDTTWITLVDDGGLFVAYPNDTLDIANGLRASFTVFAPNYLKYRYIVYGTSGDTTRIITTYSLK